MVRLARRLSHLGWKNMDATTNNIKMMHGLTIAILIEILISLVMETLESMQQQLVLVLSAKVLDRKKPILLPKMMHGSTIAIQEETHSLLVMETLESMPQHHHKLVSNAKVLPKRAVTVLPSKRMMHGLMTAILIEIHLLQEIQMELVLTKMEIRELMAHKTLE